MRRVVANSAPDIRLAAAVSTLPQLNVKRAVTGLSAGLSGPDHGWRTGQRIQKAEVPLVQVEHHLCLIREQENAKGLLNALTSKSRTPPA